MEKVVPTKKTGPREIARQPHLSVTGTVCHSPVDDQPRAIDLGLTHMLTSDEQSYGPRKLKVGVEWRLLIDQNCWVTEPSYIVVQNEAPQRSVIPTPEQRDQAALKVLIIGIQMTPESELIPLETIPLYGHAEIIYPLHPGAYRICCPAGASTYTLTVIPK